MPYDHPTAVSRAANVVRGLFKQDAETAIILGSGLGGLANKIEDPTVIGYGDIPGFAPSTVGGHRGQLILGSLFGKPVVAMAGRFHRYEGLNDNEVAFPVHVMHALGAQRLIVSNAAGGVNPKLSVGDVVVIRDHINWLFGSPTDGVSTRSLATRVYDEVYDPEMSAIALKAANQHGFTAIEGTYLSTLGPTYETRAEYRMMRVFGADVAGMSTIPEVLAASSKQMRILGLTMVSNVANPDMPDKTDHQEVLDAGNSAAVKMENIVRAVLNSVSK